MHSMLELLNFALLPCASAEAGARLISADATMTDDETSATYVPRLRLRAAPAGPPDLQGWAPASSGEAEDEDVGHLERKVRHALEGTASKCVGVELAEVAFKNKAFSSQVDQLERTINASFLTISKNEYGNLGHSGLRYLLHRYFMYKYTWSVLGLDTRGAAWNNSSPVLAFDGYLPIHIQGVLEKRLGGRGFGLRWTALFAAALESLIRALSIQQLKSLYYLAGWNTSGKVRSNTAQLALEHFMSSYILGFNVMNITRAEWADEMKDISDKYFPWAATQDFLRRVRDRVEPARREWPFSVVADVAMHSLEEWGLWSGENECGEIKDKLVRLEDSSTGCVRLSKFYGSMVNGSNWQFNESPEYLRSQGALESGNTAHPHVLTANYVNSLGNCVWNTTIFSVCCMNECLGLFAQLEKQLLRPDATPAQIVSLVSALPSSSTRRNRSLPSRLIRRLDAIADQAGGRVQLHGRLFAQWMHYLYPHECPFPHLSGTTMPTEPWNVIKPQANEFDVTRFVGSVEQRRNFTKPAVEYVSCMPWQDQEELLERPFAFPHTLSELESDEYLWMITYGVALITGSTSLLLVLWRSTLSLRRSSLGVQSKAKSLRKQRPSELC